MPWGAPGDLFLPGGLRSWAFELLVEIKIDCILFRHPRVFIPRIAGRVLTVFQPEKWPVGGYKPQHIDEQVMIFHIPGGLSPGRSPGAFVKSCLSYPENLASLN